MSSNFSKLIEWYSQQCDGTWEHENGFNLQTIDNPGLLLKIDLIGTALERKEFKTVSEGMGSKKPWLHCSKTGDGCFEGACHPQNFERVVGIFLAWSQQ